MGHMTRTQISLDERQYRFAKRRAAEQGVSLSAYIRALVDERIEMSEEKIYSVMDLVGLFEDGEVTAENVDDILVDEALGIRRPADGDDGE